ncbi:MAG TPA: VanZ family protein [Clostridia bacterium]|nr:VanZ family protein [Clostridia bacterium]
MELRNKWSGSKLTRILAWSFTAVWMLAIFILSAQPGNQSGNLSLSVTQLLVRFVSLIVPLNQENIANPDWLNNFNGLIRECAHGAAYFVLALLAANALKKHSLKGLKLILLTLAFCAVYAASDEIHQLFVSGRACELFDFEVDMLGAALSMILFQIVSFLAGKIRRRTAGSHAK